MAQAGIILRIDSRSYLKQHDRQCGSVMDLASTLEEDAAYVLKHIDFIELAEQLVSGRGREDAVVAEELDAEELSLFRNL